MRTLHPSQRTSDRVPIEGSGMAMVTPVREQIPKRFRPSPALYKFTYSALIQKQGGEHCLLCKRTRADKESDNSPVKLEIDHVDGRKESWVFDKLSIKCRRCNRSRFLSALACFGSVNERENTSNASWEAQRSVELQPALEAELDRLLQEASLTVIDAQNRLGKICGCDQQTVARFIDRETTPEGKYILSSRVVSDGRKKRTLQFVSRKNHAD